ncbi:hypothetical protein NIES2101_03955 [Calothrix sp. HK-06]|nr:hypothetical protein NIES2101_03955 [Calothrix sp. HK-06]
MKKHCLTREQLSRLFEINFDSTNLQSDEADFKVLVEDWENWELEFICLSTLLSQFLESKQKQSEDATIILNKIYALSESRGLFTVEEMDNKFIEYMFKYVRKYDLDIEDNLVEIRGYLGEHKY